MHVRHGPYARAKQTSYCIRDEMLQGNNSHQMGQKITNVEERTKVGSTKKHQTNDNGEETKLLWTCMQNGNDRLIFGMMDGKGVRGRLAGNGWMTSRTGAE